MAARRQRLPVGAGDCVVVRQGMVGWFVFYGLLIALFLLAIVTSVPNQPEMSGKVGAVVLFGLFIALFVFGLVVAFRHRSRLEISPGQILWVNHRDDTLTLDRELDGPLRLYNAQGNANPLWRLTGGNGAVKVPVNRYRQNRLRELCAAKGWEFVP